MQVGITTCFSCFTIKMRHVKQLTMAYWLSYKLTIELIIVKLLMFSIFTKSLIKLVYRFVLDSIIFLVVKLLVLILIDLSDIRVET